MKKDKDFKERLIELVKDDKELHDATVRLINAHAEQTEQANEYRKARWKTAHLRKMRKEEKRNEV